MDWLRCLRVLWLSGCPLGARMVCGALLGGRGVMGGLMALEGGTGGLRGSSDRHMPLRKFAVKHSASSTQCEALTACGIAEVAMGCLLCSAVRPGAK